MAVVHDIPSAQYHDDRIGDQPSLSCSIAKLLISRSPRHAWYAHPRLNPDYERQEDDKFSIGTVAHALLLEGTELVDVIYADDWRTKAAKEARDEARANGRVPLLEKDWEEVQSMVESVRNQLGAHEADPPLFRDGKPEQTLLWKEDGVLCRARLDWLHDDLSAVDDFKTTSRPANPESWSRTLFSMGYDVQAAFYLRGLAALAREMSGDYRVTTSMFEFRLVVAETSPPYAISVLSLAPDALALADAKVDYAIRTWKRCLAADDWPAYPAKVAYAEAPPWAEAEWMERDEAAA